MAKKSEGRISFSERDPSDVATDLAEAFEKFVFSSTPTAPKKTKWTSLGDEVRTAISAEMLNEPQECEVVKQGTASIVQATCQSETGGGCGIYEICIAYQKYKDADWKVVWYLKEDTD